MGFSLFDIVGFGFFLLPFTLLLAIPMMWPRESISWAAVYGGSISLVMGFLDAFHIFGPSMATASAQTVLTLPPVGVILFFTGSVLALVGGVRWPTFRSEAMIVGGAFLGWGSLFMPEVAPELIFFLAPGFVMVGLAVIRAAGVRLFGRRVGSAS
ncbi:MAG: hypothetical protein ACYDDF_00505 [Thermoplasmatota archaeon]